MHIYICIYVYTCINKMSSLEQNHPTFEHGRKVSPSFAKLAQYSRNAKQADGPETDFPLGRVDAKTGDRQGNECACFRSAVSHAVYTTLLRLTSGISTSGLGGILLANLYTSVSRNKTLGNRLVQEGAWAWCPGLDSAIPTYMSDPLEVVEA